MAAASISLPLADVTLADPADLQQDEESLGGPGAPEGEDGEGRLAGVDEPVQ
jgi:hypothetical protein